MAEDVLEETVIGDPVPKQKLADEHRAKLDSIVQRMISNKESDEAINMVVNDFKTKYTSVEQPKQQAQSPQKIYPKEGETHINLDGQVAVIKNGTPLLLRKATEEDRKTIPMQTEPFKSMSDWLNIPQAAQPIVQENVVNDHTAKTSEASERVKGHLNDIDNSVRNLLYSHKKELGGRLKSQQLAVNPSESGPINFQAQQLEQKDKQDVYVSPVEVESFKSEMPNNPVLLRRGLEQKAIDLTKTNPAEAKALKADVYRLDRQNNPEKESKIAKNIDKINTGELDYDIVNGQLTKPISFFGGLVEGFKEKNKAFEDFEVYETKNESDIIKHLNKKLTHDSDEPVIVGGELGMMIGGQPLKPIAGGLLAGAVGGPAAGAAAMTMISGPEMYKLGYANALPQNYAAIKKENPGISDIDAYHQASELADKQASVDAATGMAMGLVGGKLAFKPTGLNVGLLQKSLGSALLQIGEATTKKTLEGLGVGTIGATGQVVKNIMAQKEGLPVDTDFGIKEQLIGGIGMTMGMAMIAKFPEILKPKTYNQILQAFKGVPKETIETTLGELEKTGEITPEQSQTAQKTIQEHQAIDNSIKPNVPEADRIKVQELIKERNELQASLETEDPAYHPDTKEKIKKLNERINGVSKGEERGELQTLVDKADKNKELFGFAAKELKDQDEKTLKTFFKDIAEQAHDPATERLTIDTFGESIVNKAKELYPKQEPKAIKLKDPTITKVEDGDLYEFKTAEGLVGGVMKSPTEFRIDGISANEVGTGQGTALFESLINYLKDKGVTKLTTESAGEGAIKMHQKAVEKGLLTEISREGGKAEFKINGVEKPKVSVIQPGEIKQPETITISPRERPSEVKSTDKVSVIMPKTKENAISERSPEAVIVDETSGNRPQMEPGIPESGEAPNAQTEGETPKAEDTPTGQEKVSEPEMQGITHAEMDKVSRELGLPEYSKDPETFEGWTREAKDRMAKDPDSINKLINKLRNGDLPDPVETQIMKMHFAALKDKYNKNPTPELLNEINRTKDLYNISGREEGKRLVARKGLMPVDESSLADFHLRDVDFNKGAPLTEEQLAQSTKEFKEISAVKTALDEKVMKLDAENAKLKAEKAVEKISKITKKGEPRDFKAERDQVLKDMKKKWDDSKGQLSATFVPYADRLIKIAPDAAKLVKLLVEEGIEKLPELVKAAHNHLKNFIPEITERDVHDLIAGEYSRKQTRNQLSATLYDLRKEARLMNELDQLLQGEIPQNQKRQVRRNQRIEELRGQIKELKDEMGLNDRTDAEKLASLKGRYKTKIKELEDKIAKGDYGPDEKPVPITLDKEGKELRDKYLELKEQREIRLLEQEYANRNMAEKIGGVVSKTLKTGRTLQSSFDVSYPFRQTDVGLARQLFALPFKKRGGEWQFTKFEQQKQLAGQFGKMYQSFGSEKVFRRVMDDIHKDPNYEKWQKAGLDFADPISNLDKAKEEMFQGSYAEDIPLAKHGVKASHRAATVIANKMKWDIVNQLAEKFQDRGRTFENSPELYEATAKYANQLVGRGFLGKKLENAAPVIAHFVYSLRLYASRLQLLTNFMNPRFYMKVPKEIRVEYFKDMAKFVALGGTVMGLAAAAGLKVGMNPFGSDFGSIIAGDTRYDIWGGFKQYVVLFSKFFGGRALDSHGNTKKLREFFTEEDSEYGEKSRGDVLLRFLRTKASPELAMAINITTGKDFANKNVTVGSAAKDFFVPLIYKDVEQALKDGRVSDAMINFLLASHGVAVQDYGKEKSGSSGGGGASGKTGKQGKPTKKSKPSKNTK